MTIYYPPGWYSNKWHHSHLVCHCCPSSSLQFSAIKQTSARWKCLGKIGRTGTDRERGCAGEWNEWRHDDWTIFLGWICMANSILSTVEVDMELRSIVLRLCRYRILLECRSLYPLSSDLCISAVSLTLQMPFNHYNAEVTFIQGTRIQRSLKTIWTLSCWHSLDSSRWVLSNEDPCTRVTVTFQVFCIISYWPN